jgi:hypothetical protein
MSETTHNIKILEQDSEPVDLESMSEHERNIFYEVTKMDEGMVDAVESFLAVRHNMTEPHLDELLLRKIVMISKTIQALYDYPVPRSHNYIAVPIIGDIYNLSIREGGAGARPKHYYGFKKKGLQNKKQLKHHDGAYIVRFDEPTRCMTEKEKIFIAHANEEISVIGIYVELPQLDEDSPLSRLFVSGAWDAPFLAASSLSRMSTGVKLNKHKLIFRGLSDANGALSGIFHELRDLYNYFLSLSAAFVYYETASHRTLQMRKLYEKVEKQIRIRVAKSKPLELAEPMRHLLRELGDITKQNYIGLPRDATLSALNRNNLLPVYYAALHYGRDDSVVRKLIDQAKNVRARYEMQISLSRRQALEFAMLSTYRAIIRDKIGAKRANEIDMKLRSGILSVAKLLAYLSPKERDLVSAEYVRKQKLIEDKTNNKCGHLRDLAKYNNAILGRDKYAALDTLKNKWFEDKKRGAQEMIKCSTCHHDIMCPHAVEYAQMEKKGESYDKIRATMQKYIMKQSYDIGYQVNYYCNICGDTIARIEDFGNVERSAADYMDDELKTAMWADIISVVKTLKFGVVMSVNKLVAAIRERIYPFVAEMDRRLSRSKTNIAEVIAARKKLNISVYAYAYIIHLCASNKDITFRDMKTRGTALSDLMKHAFLAINSTRNMYIRAIPGYTAELLKVQLIEAYKNVAKEGAAIIEYSDEQQNMLNNLVYNPVVHMLYWLRVVYDKMRGPLAKNIDKIMGASVEKLTASANKDTDIFDAARLPQTVMSSKSVIAASARLFFLSYIQKRIYREFVYIDTSHEGEMSSDFRPPHKKYLEECAAIMVQDVNEQNKKKMRFMKAYDQFPNKNTTTFVKTKNSLGRLYDEDGNPHKWTIYICDDNKEYTMAQLGALLLDAPNVVDRRCEICKVKFSEAAKKIDENIVKETLTNIQTTDNFYRFYENRCLSGGTHEFGGDNKCTKCGMGRTKPAKQSEALLFYKKHKDKYNKDKEEFMGAPVSSATKIRGAELGVKERKEKYDVEYKEWSFDFNTIMSLAEKIGISQNILNCVGAIERQDFNEVKSGKVIPSEAEEKYNTRAYNIAAHIKNIIMRYNNVRYYVSLSRPLADITDLIDKSGVPRHKYKDLTSMLPEVANDFKLRFDYFVANRKPRELVSFCLQTMCEMCLAIWSGGDNKEDNKITEKLRHSFVKWVMGEIIKSEEMISKPGQFNWNLLYGDRAGSEKSGTDSTEGADSVEVETTEIEDEEEGKKNAFSGINELDIDDNEGADDDDMGNDIRVTGYSLD